ncbi:hypothetical protein [Mesorhizobium sp.]|uniref:hypothetical protein n=1 Tax=Mesorhizobium sp. TaxID=1871066 RepID=UPI00257BF32C|nr:hypothetical protein [Mesorhizobium sp.]
MSDVNHAAVRTGNRFGQIAVAQSAKLPISPARGEIGSFTNGAIDGHRANA